MDGYDQRPCRKCNGKGKTYSLVIFSRTCPRCHGDGVVNTPDFNWLRANEPTLSKRPNGLSSARLQKLVSAAPPGSPPPPVSPPPVSPPPSTSPILNSFIPATPNKTFNPNTASNSDYFPTPDNPVSNIDRLYPPQPQTDYTKPIVIQPPAEPLRQSIMPVTPTPTDMITGSFLETLNPLNTNIVILNPAQNPINVHTQQVIIQPLRPSGKS